MNLLVRLAAVVLMAVAAGACPAAAEPVADLSVAAVRHAATCPLPKAGACVIRKPVSSGYRVLTPGIDLDDRGDYWIADFAAGKETSTLRATLRIVGSGGDLHEIRITFGNAVAPKAAGQKK